MHTICVLGGTGFVGRHIVARLVKRGHRVRVLTRHRERHRDLLVLPGCEVVEANIHNQAELSARMAGCGVAINLVGILAEQGGHGDFNRVHVELPRKLIEACGDNRINRVLHMSALNADAERGPSRYLKTKGEGEALMHRAESLQVTSFRPSVIFGPEDHFFNRFAGLLRLTPLVFPLACPNARFAPVYVGDVAECFVRAVDDKRTYGERYELCGPKAYTLKELVEYAARQSGLRRRVIGLGTALSRLQARVFEFVPGKPFTRDNYLSLQVDAVCREGFPAVFGLQPVAVEAVVPTYLGPRQRQAMYQFFRRAAGRK